MSNVEEGKFVRMFGRSEIRLTACAVTRDLEFDYTFLNFGFSDKFLSFFDLRSGSDNMKVKN